MHISKRIVALRAERDLSQNDLARQIGVGKSSIAHWELGTREPTVKHRARLAEVFGVPLEQLLPEVREDQAKTVVITEPELIAFVRHYRKLNPRARRSILTVAQTLAGVPSLTEPTTPAP
jgi:transcriptional regulator with XRE-family HTH domain